MVSVRRHPERWLSPAAPGTVTRIRVRQGRGALEGCGMPGMEPGDPDPGLAGPLASSAKAAPGRQGSGPPGEKVRGRKARTHVPGAPMFSSGIFTGFPAHCGLSTDSTSRAREG